jgi:hypothetical protein
MTDADRFHARLVELDRRAGVLAHEIRSETGKAVLTVLRADWPDPVPEAYLRRRAATLGRGTITDDRWTDTLRQLQEAGAIIRTRRGLALAE